MRPWHIALIFAACLVLLAAATGWLSWTALRLERAEALARAHAAQEENIRLALWRMDSALAPLLAQERARPYFVYSAFYPAEAAYARMFSDLELGEVLIPSPLLTAPPYVLVHFQADVAGAFTSPQVPTGRLRALASAYATDEQIATAEQRLAEIRTSLAVEQLIALLPPPPAGPPPTIAPLAQQPGRGPQPQVAGQQPGRQVQSERNVAEYQARAQQMRQSAEQQQTLNVFNAPYRPSAGVREGVFEPRWLAGRLMLARRVEVEGQEYVQGCWLDWDQLRTLLLDSVRDLVSGAQLEPAANGVGGERERLLAGLPARLIVAEPAPRDLPVRPQVWLPLAAAAACVVLAAAAVAVLLGGTVALSERRAAFVSAVTHELRTPLTTFRLYSEMLANGLVPDEAARARYLETLQAEAVRLSHLVENVLAYARLERRRGPSRPERITVVALMERLTERLRRRAEQAGMELSIEIQPLRDAVVQVDAAAVEQILFNLVDNACKYAAGTADRRIHIRGMTPADTAAADRIALHVSDHGPGIGREARGRLFTPFHKSAAEAAGSAPGVGLGLALSRRLARAMRGDLRYEPSGAGACFVLVLPRASDFAAREHAAATDA